MGHTIRLNLISASKYLKYLRPKFIQHFGRINQERAQIGQKSRLQTANIIKHLRDDSLQEFILKPKKPNDGPLKKYLKNGGLRTYQSYKEMDNCLEKYAKKISDDSNHFLRLDQYLQQTDSFLGNGSYLKVSNILQVQNYCFYLEEVQKIFNQHPNCEWARQYQDVGDAKQIFTNCYEQMKKEKEETYLIFDISN